MEKLFHRWHFVKIFIDDLLVMTRGDFLDHVKKVREALTKIERSGLKVKVKKCVFATKCLKYLGFRIDTNGISPLEEKVEAIRQIAPPRTLKQLRAYIGLFNFYKSFYPSRLHILSPLTEATTATRKFKWTPKMKEAFDKSKDLIANQVKLVYPDFTKPFYLNTDASELQLGAVKLDF